MKIVAFLIAVLLLSACVSGSPGSLGLVRYRDSAGVIAPDKELSQCEYETGLAAGGMYVPRDSLMKRCMQMRGYHQTLGNASS